MGSLIVPIQNEMRTQMKSTHYVNKFECTASDQNQLDFFPVISPVNISAPLERCRQNLAIKVIYLSLKQVLNSKHIYPVFHRTVSVFV